MQTRQPKKYLRTYDVDDHACSRPRTGSILPRCVRYSQALLREVSGAVRICPASHPRDSPRRRNRVISLGEREPDLTDSQNSIQPTNLLSVRPEPTSAHRETAQQG
jgi:hypothetical protein